MTRTIRFILPIGVIALSMAGCRGSDAITDPSPRTELAQPGAPNVSRDGQRGNNSENQRDDTVRTLKRTFKINARISASRTIGIMGGEISLPGSGAKAIFPPFSVLQPTLITMTAREGDDVAYDFQPHMTFQIPVVVQQELGATNAIGKPSMLTALAGAYFEGDLERNYTDVSRRFVHIKEVSPGMLDASGRKFTFLVWHFSGYLASSGKADRSDSSDDH